LDFWALAFLLKQNKILGNNQGLDNIASEELDVFAQWNIILYVEPMEEHIPILVQQGAAQCQSCTEANAGREIKEGTTGGDSSNGFFDILRASGYWRTLQYFFV
jgi:hypothetical protein